MSSNLSIVPDQPVNIVFSWALWLASFGIWVFPLHFVNEDGSCSCGNPDCGRNAGKHPMTEHGFKDATNDPEKVRYFWNGEPDANIGICTGAQSGIVVVDIDPRHGGNVTWQQLVAQHGQPPCTPMLKTGSGGWHIYFRHPGPAVHIGNRQNMAPGIDLRGDGGYVVGPGSNHVEGFYDPVQGCYLPDVALAPMPQWLLDLALNNTTVAAPAAAPSADTSIAQGSRHPVLFSLAGTMRAKGMSRSGIEAAIRAENLARCSPPLPDTDIQKIVTGIMKYPAGSLPKGEMVSSTPREEAVLETISAFESAADPKVTSSNAQWVVEGYLALGSITLITGKPKLSGKSTFVGFVARSVLEGAAFLGHATAKSPIVWLTEERSTFEELLRRTGLLGRDDLRFLRYDPGRSATFAEQILAASEVCKEIGAKVLVVDTLAQFVGLQGDSENASGFWYEELPPLQTAAKQGLAVIVTHHEKKSGGEVGESGRGSSAFAGAVDIILSLRRPEGAPSSSVRVIHALSRFTATPEVQFMELTEQGYEPRDEGGVVMSQVEKQIANRAPATEPEAKSIADLIDGTDIKEPTARKVIDKMVHEGTLRRTGEGKKGTPFRYYRAAQILSYTAPSIRVEETNPVSPATSPALPWAIGGQAVAPAPVPSPATKS